jgi:high-affinity iron transporter
MDWSAAIPTFLITLREGVEAALVVGIVLACIRRAQQPQLVRQVYMGIAAGLGGSVMVGSLLIGLVQRVGQGQGAQAVFVRQLLELGLGIVAIAMLSWMLIWMTGQARTLKAEIEGTVQSALTQNPAAAWGVFTLVGTAVLREGFETVIFLAAKFQEGWIPVAGAMAGLGGAVLIGLLLFRWGVRIDLKRFFQVMGIFLLLIVAGLVISALRHLDIATAAWVELNPNMANLCWSAGNSCLLGPLVWNGHDLLPDRQFPGIVLKTLFGYREMLYSLQILAYAVFLGTVGALYFRSLNPSETRVVQAKEPV